LQTFAGQAVLAIENARLFQELGARGEEARRARTAAEAALADLRRAQDRLIRIPDRDQRRVRLPYRACGPPSCARAPWSA
jgi:GAF domain-containing protein